MHVRKNRDCVLVVDDDHDTRVSLRDAIEQLGDSVYSATNGEAAWELLESKNFNPYLIILDLMMPIMNGHEFLDALRKDPTYKDIPVIVITASHEKLVRSDIQCSLKKPVDLNLLLAAIAKVKSTAKTKVTETP